jgi:hypothetical protein
MYRFEIINLKELEENYPNLLETAKITFPNLHISDIVKMCSLVIGTCGSCRDSHSSCQCWNDE